MTTSERICSELAQLHFYKEFVYDNLVFLKDQQHEVEFADLLMNFYDAVIVCQIKERNPHGQTDDIVKEKS